MEIMKEGAHVITLRPVTNADREFLLRVYDASREIELSVTGWNADQRRAFVEHQFSAQDAHYREYYPEASFDVILFNGEPAGRLYVDRGDEHTEILDITVLPEYRGRGIATAMVRGITDEAAAAGRVVSIYIESFNPSQKLFGRFGFAEAGGDDIVRRFECHANRNN